VTEFEFAGHEKFCNSPLTAVADNPYLPHNHCVASVVYTGTHDNDTTLAWFENLPAETQLRAVEYLGYPPRVHAMAAYPFRLRVVSQLAIIPMQDLFGTRARISHEYAWHDEGNWRWRFAWEQLPPDLMERLRRMTMLYGRN